MRWIVFKDKSGNELAAYTLEGTFPGEMEETKRLLANDHGIAPEDIYVEYQER